MRIRNLILVSTAVAAALAVMLLVAVPRTSAHFALTNRADEPIARIRVAAFGEEATAGPIAPGESAAVDLPVAGEGAFTIEAEFASGRRVASGAIGYITPGIAQSFAVEIGARDIRLDQPVP